MKILINLEVIKSLKPCLNRYENYLKHYTDFEGSLEDFLDLPEVTHNDKLWVSLRLMPRFLAEVFAIDCAAASASASAYAAASASAYAASAYAAYAAAVAASAAYAAAGASEKQRQIEALIYLIQSHEE